MAKKCTLYFIYNSLTDRLKIGVSTNVEKRVTALECASGARLDLLGFIERCSDLERPLHNVLAGIRERGEWFTPTEELLRIARNPSRQRIKEFIKDSTVSKGAWRRRKNMETEAKERRSEIRVSAAHQEAIREDQARDTQRGRNQRMLGLA